MSYNSTLILCHWREHQIRAQSCKTAHPSDTNRKTVFSSVLLTDQLWIRGFSVNLSKQLTELRRTFCLLDYWFILIKGYNSGTARGKRCIEQSVGEGFRASMPSSSTPLSPGHVLTTGVLCQKGDKHQIHISRQSQYHTPHEETLPHSLARHISRRKKPST